MRRTVQTLVLTLALSASTYAGEMQFPVASPTTPPPAGIEQTADGETPNNADGDMQNGAANTFTGAALNLLAGVLAII